MNIQTIKKTKLWLVADMIRNYYRFPNAKKVINQIKNDKNIAILLGTSTFNNLGDHLISDRSLEYMHSIISEKKIIEIPTQMYLKQKNTLKEIVDVEVPIFIVGGGWMGSIWPNDEYIMQDMLSTFSSNNIIILPQTIYYDLSVGNDSKIMKDAQKTYKMCKKLLMFLRDEKSYDFAKLHFGKYCDVYMAPDIGLYNTIIQKSIDVKKEKKIAICFRQDREKCDNKQIEKYIQDYASKKNYKLKRIDTIKKYSIPIWKRKRALKDTIRLFSRNELVITDRLHGMIFAAISNTKCIAFDNKSKKVSGVYKLWLKNNKNIMIVNEYYSKAEFFNSIDCILKTQHSNEECISFLNKKFLIMSNIIYKMLGKKEKK